MVVWIFLFSLISGVACGTAQHPASALDEYVAAVRAGDADAVYDMLGEELRGDMDRAAFRDFFDENYDEIVAQTEQIESALDDEELEIQAALPVSDHGELALDYDEAEWRLVDDVPAVAGASSPRGTLLALSDAIERKDLSALLLLLSKEKSDTLNAELSILKTGLADVEDDDIIVNGDAATVYLDWGLKLELVFEDGAWRMHKLDQQ